MYPLSMPSQSMQSLYIPISLTTSSAMITIPVSSAFDPEFAAYSVRSDHPIPDHLNLAKNLISPLSIRWHPVDRLRVRYSVGICPNDSVQIKQPINL